MKKAIGLAVTAFAVSLAAAAPAAHAAAPLPTDTPVLFSTQAPASTVTVSAYSTSVTIPADSPTTWFTDRPNRKAGMTTAGQLASRWKSYGFEAIAPNAAIVMRQGDTASQVVVTLSRPRIEGPVVTFTATPLSKEKVLGMASRGVPKAGSYGATELFIDGTATVTTTRTFSGDCRTVTEVTTTTNADGTTTQTSSTMTYTPFDDAYQVCTHLRLGGKTVNV
jgi:hypothetical protein